MRDRTAARNYSPEKEEFRRDHERRRAWGLKRRHARKLAHLRAAGAGPAAPPAAVPQCAPADRPAAPVEADAVSRRAAGSRPAESPVDEPRLSAETRQHTDVAHPRPEAGSGGLPAHRPIPSAGPESEPESIQAAPFDDLSLPGDSPTRIRQAALPEPCRHKGRPGEGGVACPLCRGRGSFPTRTDRPIEPDRRDRVPLVGADRPRLPVPVPGGALSRWNPCRNALPAVSTGATSLDRPPPPPSAGGRLLPGRWSGSTAREAGAAPRAARPRRTRTHGLRGPPDTKPRALRFSGQGVTPRWEAGHVGASAPGRLADQGAPQVGGRARAGVGSGPLGRTLAGVGAGSPGRILLAAVGGPRRHQPPCRGKSSDSGHARAAMLSPAESCQAVSGRGRGSGGRP
jgi:hypothetical protein